MPSFETSPERKMASNDYQFITHWDVTGSAETVYEILIQGTEYPRWWPQVYLEVEETDAGGLHGLGKSGRLLTKGWLPYTLRWAMTVTAVNFPSGFTLRATGDFDGTGVWEFVQHGPRVAIRFDWRIRADKPLLKWLSFVFKPFFRANHHWAMARGQEALQRELSRRSGMPE